jgi:transposase
MDGESMTTLCEEFGISRKTGYKIFNRYKDDGLEALTDPAMYKCTVVSPTRVLLMTLLL